MRKYFNVNLMALCATSIICCSCGINTKPEHSQVYEDFSNRRPPRENQLILDGAYSNTKTQPSSNFNRYSGKVDESGSSNHDTQNNKSNQNVNIKNNGDAQQNDGSSFYERLKNKFSSSSPNVMPKLSFRQNNFEQTVEQGDADNYTYYDLAESIPTSAFVKLSSSSKLNNTDTLDLTSYEPVSGNNKTLPIVETVDSTQLEPVEAEDISQFEIMEPVHTSQYQLAEAKGAAEFQLAEAKGAARPLVELPENESMDEIKQQADAYSKPELKNVPIRSKNIDEYQNNEVVLKVKQNIKSAEANYRSSNINKNILIDKKAKSHDALPNINEALNEHNDHQINDKTAKLESHNGHKILMGSLGNLRKTLN